MKRIPIKCKRCGGLGHTFLSSVYERTYTILRKYGETTGAKLARVEGIAATAMNMRLKVLENHGMVTARRDGRQVFYQVVEAANAQA